MSKTLKLNVSFPMSIVISTATMLELARDRKECRDNPAIREEMTGEARAGFDLLVSERTDEELLELIYRKGIRQIIREDFIKELCGNESTGRTGDVKVVFLPWRKDSTNCQGCIVETCPFPENLQGNEGCPSKQTGVRPAVTL